MKWYRKAAAQGFAAGQNNLGICYRDAIGVPQDFSKAAYWFKLASEQGLATAQNNLGVRYYKGQGVQTNYVEAAKLYRKAAEKGLPDALVNLAICYTDGRGVPKDKVKAFINVKNLSDEDYINNNFIVMCTKNGTIKKTALEAY